MERNDNTLPQIYMFFNKDFKGTVAFVWRCQPLSFMTNPC